MKGSVVYRIEAMEPSSSKRPRVQEGKNTFEFSNAAGNCHCVPTEQFWKTVIDVYELNKIGFRIRNSEKSFRRDYHTALCSFFFVLEEEKEDALVTAIERKK